MTQQQATDPTELALKAEADALQQHLAGFRAIVPDTQEIANYINTTLVEVKTRARALDVQEKSATKPINDALAVVRGWFRPAKNAYSELEAILKSKLGEWDRLLATQKAEQMAAAAAAFRATEPERGLALMQAVPEGPSVAAGTSIRKVWKFEVIDPASVPRELCEPVDKLIRQAIALGHREIPGVRVYEDLSVRVTI